VLYEYWCFLKVVEQLRSRFGGFRAHQAFRLIDEVYRPELAPGQSFCFRTRNATVTVWYEPEFHPAGWRRSGLSKFRAALVDAPLRPDIVIEAMVGNDAASAAAEPLWLVMDSKSVERFSNDHFHRISDYRSALHDPETGHQPARQLFLLHRDERTQVFCNLPGYLEGKAGDRNSMIIGAVSLMPGTEHSLELVIDRFLEIAGVDVGEAG
jgi:hypothetical protein